jgi:hypothetical protein
MAVYIFDCPVHGEERNVLCFRALDPKNRSLWRKAEITLTPAPFEEGELKRFLDKLKCSTTDPSATEVKIGYGL